MSNVYRARPEPVHDFSKITEFRARCLLLDEAKSEDYDLKKARALFAYCKNTAFRQEGIEMLWLVEEGKTTAAERLYALGGDFWNRKDMMSIARDRKRLDGAAWIGRKLHPVRYHPVLLSITAAIHGSKQGLWNDVAHLRGLARACKAKGFMNGMGNAYPFMNGVMMFCAVLGAGGGTVAGMMAGGMIPAIIAGVAGSFASACALGPLVYSAIILAQGICATAVGAARGFAKGIAYNVKAARQSLTELLAPPLTKKTAPRPPETRPNLKLRVPAGETAREFGKNDAKIRVMPVQEPEADEPEVSTATRNREARPR